MNKKSLLIFALVIVFVGGIFLAWKSKERSAEILKEEVKTDTTSSTIDTSDWKTYRNEEYGFELMVPKDWVIPNGPKISGGTRTIFLGRGSYSEGCCSGIRIELRNEPLEQVHNQLISEYPKEDILSDTEESISNIQVRKITFLTHYGDKNEKVIIVPFSKNKVTVFRYGDGDIISDQVFNSLSSFRR